MTGAETFDRTLPLVVKLEFQDQPIEERFADILKDMKLLRPRYARCDWGLVKRLGAGSAFDALGGSRLNQALS